MYSTLFCWQFSDVSVIISVQTGI